MSFRNQLFGLVATATLVTAPLGAENRIDQIRPDAPQLSKYGEHSIGVRTVEVANKSQIEMVRVVEDHLESGDLPRYDRPLILEIWYPSAPGGEPSPYEVYLRDGQTRVEVHGKAVRDAEPDKSGAPYPLVLVSHGYPGNRYLLSHLAENLASKGYVVASIDHTDSTYRTRAAFQSTLVNRSLDQLFVLDEVAARGTKAGSFLNGLLDAERTGLIGYSMGGYGAVITSGGGVAQEAVEQVASAGTLGIHLAGSREHQQHFDDRIKAVVSFAPWGMEAGFWNAKGLAGIRVPTLFIAGSVDDVSGYEGGTKAIFEQAIHVDRSLLTFENANHNAAAPMPAPAESYIAYEGQGASFSHYAEAVWDTVRMNNIAQHFVTAYLGKLLKGNASMDPYLNLITRSGDGVWAANADGSKKPEHTYWAGFQNRTAAGLRWETLPAEQPAEH